MKSEFLRSVPFLAPLTPDELAALEPAFRTVEVPARDRIVEEGTLIDSLSIIARGVVHIRRRSGQREVLLARLGPGGFFGEVNLFAQVSATASVHAMTPVTLEQVGYSALRDFMSENPSAGYKIVSVLMGELAQRLSQTNNRLANSVYWNAPTR